MSLYEADIPWISVVAAIEIDNFLIGRHKNFDNLLQMKEHLRREVEEYRKGERNFCFSHILADVYRSFHNGIIPSGTTVREAYNWLEGRLCHIDRLVLIAKDNDYVLDDGTHVIGANLRSLFVEFSKAYRNYAQELPYR